MSSIFPVLAILADLCYNDTTKGNKKRRPLKTNEKRVQILQGVQTRLNKGAFIACGELEKIYYDGTISQWNLIALGENWKDKEWDYTIYCTDGTIAKDGTITYYSETQE